MSTPLVAELAYKVAYALSNRGAAHSTYVGTFTREKVEKGRTENFIMDGVQNRSEINQTERPHGGPLCVELQGLLLVFCFMR